MKHLVPSLSALALVGAAAAPLSAASIKDEKADLSLAVKGQLQTRLYLGASGESEAGADFNPVNGATGSAEAARFMIRRARIGFDAKYGDDWFGNMTIRAEGFPSSSNYNNKGAEIYYAYAGKGFRTGDVNHEIEMGLDKPFTYESANSSTAYMLPLGPQAAMEGVRGLGLQYRLKSEFVNAGVSLMNNTTTGSFAANGINDEPSDGYFYSARIEVAPGKGFMPKKAQESYLGAEGTTLLIGLEYMAETAKFSGTSASWQEQDTAWFGPDVNFHWNALTAVAAYKTQNVDKSNQVDTGTPAADPDEVKGSVWEIGAAWAIPTDMGVFEPAARLSVSDVNKDVDGGVSPIFADLDAAGSIKQSGTTIQVGVNWYIKGNANKLQLAYVNFSGEDPASGDTASAHAVVLQHNLTF